MTTFRPPPAMEPLPKQRLHQLIDELPEDEIRAAERYLEFLSASQDPLIQASSPRPRRTNPSRTKSAKPSRKRSARSPTETSSPTRTSAPGSDYDMAARLDRPGP